MCSGVSVSDTQLERGFTPNRTPPLVGTRGFPSSYRWFLLWFLFFNGKIESTPASEPAVG